MLEPVAVKLSSEKFYKELETVTIKEGGHTMKGKMQAVRLHADWDPKPDFVLGSKDVDKVQTYLGSKVWRNPRMAI